jgi:hypothetical protein
MHVGIRQYWRDLPSLLAWARSEPHRLWWRNFLRNSGGTGSWHETSLLRGGREAAARVGRPDDEAAPVVTEDELCHH